MESEAGKGSSFKVVLPVGKNKGGERMKWSVIEAPVLIFFLLLLAGPVFAGGLSTSGQGTRALGMGGAFTAVADDGASVYYNPAGISQINGQGP